MKLVHFAGLLLANATLGAEIPGQCPTAMPSNVIQVYYEDATGQSLPAFAIDLEAALIAVEVANNGGANTCFVYVNGEYIFFSFEEGV